MINSIEFICEHIPFEEMLAQLAEEATELAHAALKLRRAYSIINPTPVTRGEAWEALLEEVADVGLVLQVLGLDQPERYNDIKQAKAGRWAGRIKERLAKGQLSIEEINELIKKGIMEPNFARRYFVQQYMPDTAEATLARMEVIRK